MNYLDRLKAQYQEKQANRLLPKLPKVPFDSKDSSQTVHIPKNKPISEDMPVEGEYREASEPEQIADYPPQPGDIRRFCRQCQHSRPVYGRGAQVICCIKQNQVWLDDIPRHCPDYQSNGQPVPIVGVRWRPETQN